jgi:hypothetical protein
VQVRPWFRAPGAILHNYIYVCMHSVRAAGKFETPAGLLFNRIDRTSLTVGFQRAHALLPDKVVVQF